MPSKRLKMVPVGRPALGIQHAQMKLKEAVFVAPEHRGHVTVQDEAILIRQSFAVGGARYDVANPGMRSGERGVRRCARFVPVALTIFGCDWIAVSAGQEREAKPQRRRYWQVMRDRQDSWMI